jgi:phosphatidylethanolamine/phosphatidyl-N-methylethanolamine N-methyltransferase
MSALTFLSEFFRNWKTVGAIAPSSPALAARMMESAEVWRAERVLELGPGTGALTQGIADVMPAVAQYLGIELCEPFVNQLRQRFPKMRFELGAAQEFSFDTVLSAGESVDVIISGLPWTAFPESLQEAILDHVLPRLAPGGRFATFAYWGLHQLPAGRRFRALLHDRLPGVETTRVVWGNMPPAFVYVARKS